MDQKEKNQHLWALFSTVSLSTRGEEPLQLPACLVAKGRVMSLTAPLLMTHLKVRVIPPQNVIGLRGYLDHPSLALAGIHWYACFFR